jgi:Protein of unknown function (DUF3800)
MPAPRVGTLHVHLDESGDLNFSETGTRFYVFAVVWTYDPAPLAVDLAGLRFRLLKLGRNIDRFHATDDDSGTRELVFERLGSHRGWHFTGIVVDKRKVPPGDRDKMWRFYSRFASVPLRLLLRSPWSRKAHKILIYTDSLPHEVHRESTAKAIKRACRRELSGRMAPVAEEPARLWSRARARKIRIDEEIQKIIREGDDTEPQPGNDSATSGTCAAGVPFCVYHHVSASNIWLQVADYCAWAIRSKWENNDVIPLTRLHSHLAVAEHDLLRREGITYY